ncbi:MAG: hypothetical protein Q8867_04705, partial [Bacteroidota bacterium]|nr:hypothetical protein [Bacteroidota bacterium]
MTAVATPQKACKILIISQESKKPDKLDEVIKNAFPDSTLFFATSLQDVYQIIKNPDAIIIDNTFPFEEKYEICCSLKKDYRFQDIAIAFLSSEDERDLQEKLLKAGADCFLFSPLLTASAHAQVQSMIKLTLANRKNRFTREQLTDLVADRDILLEELQKSQEKYHTIFNNAIVGICLFDTAGKVTFYNKLMSKHMGQPGSNLT